MKQRYTVNIVQPSILNLKKAAKYLGVSTYFLRNLVKSGIFPACSMQNGKSSRNTYVFTRAALDSWANKIDNQIEK